MPEVLPVHPVTGLVALGVLRSGRIIWPVLGAAPEEDADDDGNAGDDSGQGDYNGGGQDGDGLGDAGKAALDRERKARREAEKARKAAEKELADFKAAQQAKKDGDDASAAAEQARREAEAGVLAKAKDRVNASRAEALAAGRLANPELAVKLLDMSEFEVGDDFSTDDDAISEAISDLIKKYPGLAAKAQGFQGSGDGGARTGGSRVKQVTDAELKTMTPAQIVKAQQEGRLANLIRGT